MIALKIDDMKAFTSGLFVGAVFDRFWLREAVITTFNTFKIDGHIRSGYYSKDELEQHQIGELSAWAMIKPICFSLIKGKKRPESFQITLQLPADEVTRLFEAQDMGSSAEQVAGCYLNIRYEEGALTCVTGTSMKIFILDKTIDLVWDQAVRSLLKEAGLFFMEDIYTREG